VSLYRKSHVLRRAGFEVVEARSGPEALAAVAARRPRVVVLDVNLPGLNGWEVCRRLKADELTASTLVLQVSATYVSEEDRARALEGGADACLTEPIEPPVLVATVPARGARRTRSARPSSGKRRPALRPKRRTARRTSSSRCSPTSSARRSGRS
jgi:DNA-binding response OmpR family regulator